MITDAQIEALASEAAAAGDDVQAALCAYALGDGAVPSEWSQASRDEARAECERVILEARAQS